MKAQDAVSSRSKSSSPERVSIYTKVKGLVPVLSHGIYERDRAIKAMLLAAIAGENSLLLGLPGTAKSLLARRTRLAFANDSYFEYLLTKFTTPDELFGPISIRELRENDALIRQTNGYLPMARIAFLDEVFKASSAILNSLLTIMNERVYHNGKNIENASIETIIGASNEIPEMGHGLEALYDRFLVRLRVDPVGNDESFQKLVTETSKTEIVPAALKLNESELTKIRAEAVSVTVPDDVWRVIASIVNKLRKLEEKNTKDRKGRHFISDRRWKKAVHLVKLCAYVNGRDSVSLLDCEVLEHCLWNDPADAEQTRKLLQECFRAAVQGTNAADALEAFDQKFKEVLGEIRDFPGACEFSVSWELCDEKGKVVTVLSGKVCSCIKSHDSALVFSCRVLYDSESKKFHQLEQRGKGVVMKSSNDYYERVATTLKEFEANLEDDYHAEVQKEPLKAKRTGGGAHLDIGKVSNERLCKGWLNETTEMREALDKLEAKRTEEVSALDALVDENAFVVREDADCFKEGMEVLGLAIRERGEQLRHLREALEEKSLLEVPEGVLEMPAESE